MPDHAMQKLTLEPVLRSLESKTEYRAILSKHDTFQNSTAAIIQSIRSKFLNNALHFSQNIFPFAIDFMRTIAAYFSEIFHLICQG